MRPVDTSPEAQSVQRATLSRLGSEARAEMAVEMSEAIFELALAGLRRRRPTLDEHELRLSLIELLHGLDLAAPATTTTR